MKLIRKEDFITTNWAGGTTSEVFIYPKDANVSKRNFDFRVSSATCDLDESVFSDYSGFKRYITGLDNELKMSVNGNGLEIKPFEIYSFNGSDKVIGYSKLRDFNLIYNEDKNARMYSKLFNNEILKADKNLLLVFNYESEAKINGEEFPKFSGLILKDEELSISSNGELIVCEMEI